MFYPTPPTRVLLLVSRMDPFLFADRYWSSGWPGVFVIDGTCGEETRMDIFNGPSEIMLERELFLV